MTLHRFPHCCGAQTLSNFDAPRGYSHYYASIDANVAVLVKEIKRKLRSSPLCLTFAITSSENCEEVPEALRKCGFRKSGTFVNRQDWQHHTCIIWKRLGGEVE